MATSGNFTTTNQYIVFWVEVIQNSQNIGNNTSNVTVKVWIKRTNTGYTTYGSGTVYTNINGVQRNVGITPSQTITSTPRAIFHQDLTIGHNNDGTKTLNIQVGITHDRFSSGNFSYNCALTTIPRASSFTVNNTTLDAGATVTGTITRANSSFTHNVYLGFGTKQWTLATGVGTSFSATIPMETLNEIPNATKGQGNIRVVTYNRSAEVGQKTVTFYINAPSSVVPTFSSLGIARVDNGVPSAWGVYVRGKSKATLTINGATGTYSSTISKYVIEGGGYSGTSNTLTTGTLNTSGTNTFTATITDSRGRTATKTVTCSVVDYESPKINSFTAVRCNSAGTETDEGTYVKVTANLTYSSVNSKNTLNAVVAYKTAAGTTWSSNTTVTSGTSVIIGGGGISTNTSYHFRLTINDSFSSSTITVTVPTASTTMDFKKGGKGVAIGKVAENDGFEVAWDANFLANLKVKGGLVYHVGNKPTKSDVGLGNVNNWGASSDIAANSSSQYATTNMVAKVRAETVRFDYANETTSSPHPRIYVPGKEWLRAPSGGFVPYKHQSGYLGLSNKAWYDFHTVHINSKPCRGSGGKWWNCMVDVGNDGVAEIGKYIDFHDSSTTTADYSVRLTASGSTLNCSGSFTQGSDRAFKEDIHYFDEVEMLTRSSMSESTIFKDFIRDIFRPCTFRYKDTEEVVTGFIAQDIMDTDIGKLFVRQVTVDTIDKNGEGTGEVISQDNRLVFDLSGYTTIIAKALQEEIREKDEKIKDLEERLSKLEQLILK